MPVKPINDLEAEANDLRAKLTTVTAALEQSMQLRRDDPVEYLARLVYANQQVGGTYGYEYGDLGERERVRAQEVLAICKGDLDIAESVITKLRVR